MHLNVKNIKIIKSLNPYHEISHKNSKNYFTKTNIENYSNNYYSLKHNYSSIIPKVRLRSKISSIKSSKNIEKVPKFIIDKDNFNKLIMKKKIFLDKFSNKEFNFLKNILKSKSIFPDIQKPPEEFDIKKIKQEADIDFMTKLEIAKSGRGKKNFNNLLKQNDLNIDNNNNNKNNKKNNDNNKTNRSDSPTEQNDRGINYNNNAIDNNEKLKQLENEYFNIMAKSEQLIKKKKFIIKKI